MSTPSDKRLIEDYLPIVAISAGRTNWTERA